MEQGAWTIEPFVRCGPLAFGISEADLQAIAGPFARAPRVQGNARIGWFEDHPIISAESIGGALACLELDPSRLARLNLGSVDLLPLRTMEAVAALGHANEGIYQAQGGSLYFEKIGVAVLQFDASSARTVIVWSPTYDHQESLAKVTLESVSAYYSSQRADGLPDRDLFGGGRV